MGNRSSRPPIGGIDLSAVRQMQHSLLEQEALHFKADAAVGFSIVAILLELGAQPSECDKVIDDLNANNHELPLRPSELVMFLLNMIRDIRNPQPELELATEAKDIGMSQVIVDAAGYPVVNETLAIVDGQFEPVEDHPLPPLEPSEDNPDGKDYAF